MHYVNCYGYLVVVLVLVLLSAPSYADELDDIYNLNPKISPDLSKLSPEECINQLKRGEDTLATAVILALTRDEATTLANYDRLIDALRETKGGVDEALIRHTKKKYIGSFSKDRRGFTWQRIIRSLKIAHDTPNRRKVIDSFIDLMVKVLDGKETIVDRVSVPGLVDSVIFPTLFPYVSSAYGDEESLQIAKRCMREKNELMCRSAGKVLCNFAIRDASKRKEIYDYLRQYSTGEMYWVEHAEMLIKDYPERLSYQEWREVYDNPVLELTKYLQGELKNRPRYDTAKTAILERIDTDESSYDLLLKVAGYKYGDDMLLQDLAVMIPDTAEAKAKARTDKLLAVHLDLITQKHNGHSFALSKIVFPHNVGNISMHENVLKQLKQNPPYGRDRVVNYLWMVLDDKNPNYPLLHLQAVDVLRDVAWVAPETAQEILLGAEKRLAQVNDNAISGAGNDFLRKGLPDVIKNAKQAINRYNELSPKVVEKTDK